jgi:hypothetical protein
MGHTVNLDLHAAGSLGETNLVVNRVNTVTWNAGNSLAALIGTKGFQASEGFIKSKRRGYRLDGSEA